MGSNPTPSATDNTLILLVFFNFRVAANSADMSAVWLAETISIRSRETASSEILSSKCPNVSVGRCCSTAFAVDAAVAILKPGRYSRHEQGSGDPSRDEGPLRART